MGEHIFRVFLEDLKMVRVTCKHCQRTTECAIEKLADAFNNGNCPLCKTKVLPQMNSAELGDLCMAIDHILRRSSDISVEFPITLPE